MVFNLCILHFKQQTTALAVMYNTEKLSEAALKKPKGYTIIEPFCCIKII